MRMDTTLAASRATSSHAPTPFEFAGHGHGWSREHSRWRLGEPPAISMGQTTLLTLTFGRGAEEGTVRIQLNDSAEHVMSLPVEPEDRLFVAGISMQLTVL
jgi:hypothetical protein